ncbi:MAG: hypothetical protein MUC39_03825 [Candidatus Omnitrophica bacterium]|jgi:hypothetical protein|nr:hypothetical protein [Candidatus Omnitrophota bacterium]
MFKKSALLIYFSIFILSGCMQGAMTLKRLQNSQAELKDVVSKDEENFLLLGEDLKNNRLQKGISKKEILDKYGEPIYSRLISDNTQRKEFSVYRHPTEFFSSDLIYLYFDKDKRLLSWEIKPGVEAKK